MITMEPVEGAVAIDICEPVLSSVRQKLDAVRDELMARDNFNIFRLPTHIRQRDKHLHEPLVVAIGPYGRREEPSLRAMEHHKWRYLHDFLNRSKTTIEDCLAEIKELEPRARRCYYDPVELSAENFAEILLFDGCFIIELLAKLYEGYYNPGMRVTPCSLPYVFSDLLLLENQIPLFVLEELFKIGCTAATLVQRLETPSLTELFVNFLRQATVVYLGEEIVEGNKDLIVPGEAKDFNHLLHFYYRLYVTKPQTDTTGCTDCGTILKWLNPSRIFILLLSYVLPKTGKSYKRTFSGAIPSATALLEAGVTIKKKKNQNRLSSFLDVTFCPRHGVLEIPFLSVDDSTRPLFLNLVALEQWSGCEWKKAYMSSYAAFMDCLINTPEDVAILRQRGILENNLASDKLLAVFFNQLSEWFVFDFRNHYLAELFREVGESLRVVRLRFPQPLPRRTVPGGGGVLWFPLAQVEGEAGEGLFQQPMGHHFFDRGSYPSYSHHPANFLLHVHLLPSILARN